MFSTLEVWVMIGVLDSYNIVIGHGDVGLFLNTGLVASLCKRGYHIYKYLLPYPILKIITMWGECLNKKTHDIPVHVII